MVIISFKRSFTHTSKKFLSLWKSSILEIKTLSLPAGDSHSTLLAGMIEFFHLSPVNYMYFVLQTSITHSGNRKLKRCGVGHVDFWLLSHETRKFNKISYFVTNPIYIFSKTYHQKIHIHEFPHSWMQLVLFSLQSVSPRGYCTIENILY